MSDEQKGSRAGSARGSRAAGGRSASSWRSSRKPWRVSASW